MKKLIEALNIFSKYMEDVDFPTHCEHGILFINCDSSIVSGEDLIRLNELHFLIDGYNFRFKSYFFGSC